jgi:hypothetical protein
LVTLFAPRRIDLKVVKLIQQLKRNLNEKF